MEIVDQIVQMGGVQRKYVKDDYLFRQNGTVKSLYVVEEGMVELARCQKNGSSIVLQRAQYQTILAEASIYSEKYHCDAIIKSPSQIIEIPRKRFRERLFGDQSFSDLWAAHLAREMQSARHRSEILTRRTVAERLDGWLDWKGGTFPEKGHWKSIAEQIGVSPEALYRELAKRQQ